MRERAELVRVAHRSDENRQSFVTCVNGAEQRHPTAVLIDVEDSEVQLATASADDLQRVGDAARDEHDRAAAEQCLRYQLI
jgi:hypothetical protein